MSEVYNILIVGSYPIFLDAYKKALRFKNISSVMQNREIKIVTADNLISAFIEINNRSSKNFFDFILLDIDLPRCNKIKIKSGERLGDFIHEKNPETRILVVTSCINNLGLCNI
ncbi:MAG: hypothetical protein KJO25_08305, partial [Bacteroidia bacterium]|nr:hypothetical protein [Bacteroidia bacterium]